MSEKDNIASLYGRVPAAFCMHNRVWAAIVSPSPTDKTVAVDILSIIYLKKNLRVDYKKRLTCFCGHYGNYLEFVCVVMTALSCEFLNITRQTNRGILDIKIIFMEQKEHLLCNWDSCE